MKREMDDNCRYFTSCNFYPNVSSGCLYNEKNARTTTTTTIIINPSQVSLSKNLKTWLEMNGRIRNVVQIPEHARPLIYSLFTFFDINPPLMNFFPDETVPLLDTPSLRACYCCAATLPRSYKLKI